MAAHVGLSWDLRGKSKRIGQLFGARYSVAFDPFFVAEVRDPAPAFPPQVVTQVLLGRLKQASISISEVPWNEGRTETAASNADRSGRGSLLIEQLMSMCFV